MSDHYRNPYQPREPYGAYDPYAPPPEQPNPYGGAYEPHAPGAYDYPYAPEQGQAAWPAAGEQQHGYPPVEGEPTQTWQTQTWDTQTWQQPAPVAEPMPASYGHPTGPGPLAAPGYPPDQASYQAAYQAPYQPVPEPVAEPEPAPQPEPEPARPMTAAEKAKAEGRPQILAPGLRPALLTAVLAALLALAAPLPRPAAAVPVVLLQAVTAAGWFRLNGMWPARQGIALAFLGGLAADIGLLLTDEGQAPTVIIGTLGCWLLLVIVLQLRGHASPDERLHGLLAAAGSAALAVLAAGQLAADSHAVAIGALAVAMTAPARALPLPSAASPVIALIAAAGSGIVGGQLTGVGPSGALLGLAAGICALVGLRVASYDYPSRFVHMTAGVALPLTLASPVVYVIGRVLL